MKNIIIRPAQLLYLDDLVKLEESCFTTDRMSRSNIQHLLKSSSAIILAIIKADLLIGSATLFFRKKSTTVRLYSFAIHNDYRHQGLAAQLNAAIEIYATKRDCNTIVLEVRPDNIAAIRFYLKQGYVIFGRYSKFYEDGTDALRMEKIIYAKGKEHLS